MPSWNIQSNLNRGELDPLLIGRIDLQTYYNGVQLAREVLAMPQGGLKKRSGQEYLGTALGDGRLERFSFNVEQNYLLVYTALRMQIYKDGVLQTNINGSGDDYIVTPWSLAQIADFDYIQSADTVIITHPDVETRKITRTSDTAWTITTLGFTNIPQVGFADGSSPTGVDEIQDLAFTNHVEGDRYKLSLNGILTDEIVFAGDDATNEENIRIALQNLTITSNSGISVVDTVTLDTYRVTFGGSSANAWDLLTGTAINVESATFNIATTRNQAGTSPKEDVWSATRGWPRTCTFHEGRLWMGGSKSLPATIWGSKVFDFFNFDVGRGLDDDAIFATLDTNQINAVEAIFSNRSLQIFTSGGEFYVPASPITPETVAVSIQSNMGSKRLHPVTIDGVTLFAQRTGKAVIQFVFVDAFKANESRSISVTAAHLISNPVKMDVSRGTETSDANYVYILMDDGTVAVYNTLAAEEVSGFTQIFGDGGIKSIAEVDEVLYTLVEREINSSTVYYIEVENPDLNTDSAKVYTAVSSDTLTGLGHLEGEAVWAKADGAFMGEFTVVSGEITVQREAIDAEVGLSWVPTIQTMPLNIDTKQGPISSAKKKIARASLQFFESNGMIINGQRIADKTIGQDQFDAPIPQTGLKRMSLLGWSLEATITITQDTPMDMTILNIGNEVQS